MRAAVPRRMNVRTSGSNEPASGNLDEVVHAPVPPCPCADGGWLPHGGESPESSTIAWRRLEGPYGGSVRVRVLAEQLSFGVRVSDEQ